MFRLETRVRTQRATSLESEGERHRESGKRERERERATCACVKKPECKHSEQPHRALTRQQQMHRHKVFWHFYLHRTKCEISRLWSTYKLSARPSDRVLWRMTTFRAVWAASLHAAWTTCTVVTFRKLCFCAATWSSYERARRRRTKERERESEPYLWSEEQCSCEKSDRVCHTA